MQSATDTTQSYYERNKAKILEKRKASYNPDVKKKYYEEHKDELKEKMLDIYYRKKDAQNKLRIENAMKTADDAKKIILQRVIDNQLYKTMGKKALTVLCDSV